MSFFRLPSSLFNSWHSDLSYSCFSLLEGLTRPFTRGMLTFIEQSSLREFSRTDSCVCNLKHSLPCIPSHSPQPVRGRPAVLYRSHLYWTRTRSICQPDSSSVRSGQAHTSPVISCVVSLPVTVILRFPAEIYYYYYILLCILCFLIWSGSKQSKVHFVLI